MTKELIAKATGEIQSIRHAASLAGRAMQRLEREAEQIAKSLKTDMPYASILLTADGMQAIFSDDHSLVELNNGQIAVRVRTGHEKS